MVGLASTKGGCTSCTCKQAVEDSFATQYWALLWEQQLPCTLGQGTHLPAMRESNPQPLAACTVGLSLTGLYMGAVSL